MDDKAKETRELMVTLMDQLGKKGFFFVGLIAYRDGVSDNESVRVGCGLDFYAHPKMKPLVIRMLRNAATILEAGPGERVIEVPSA